MFYAFFAYYCKFDFGKNVININKEVNYTYDPNKAMQIITPTTIMPGNSTEKVTNSTRYVIQKQFGSANKSYQYLIKLVINAMHKPETRVFLKPIIMQSVLEQLVEHKDAD